MKYGKGVIRMGEWKGKENEQETLRQFVRQERQIEFYLEGQRFWDLRRLENSGKTG